MNPIHHSDIVALDVERMLMVGSDGPVEQIMASNNLLSPTLNNLSPNIMGRTAKFAVSNKQMNKRES